MVRSVQCKKGNNLAQCVVDVFTFYSVILVRVSMRVCFEAYFAQLSFRGAWIWSTTSIRWDNIFWGVHDPCATLINYNFVVDLASPKDHHVCIISMFLWNACVHRTGRRIRDFHKFQRIQFRPVTIYTEFDVFRSLWMATCNAAYAAMTIFNILSQRLKYV